MSTTNYSKLKTNLRLAINRLKLIEKKKTETALKARKEIADYIRINKEDRARIRVEHIIREDYIVEGMEIVEMFCDTVLARFGLIQQMRQMDEGLKEAISSILWAAPRLQCDIPELKVISDLLTYKYGKEYASNARDNTLETVKAPPKLLVEKYMYEIAKSNDLKYEPDSAVLHHNEINMAQRQLLDFTESTSFYPMSAPDSIPNLSSTLNTSNPKSSQPDAVPTIIGFNPPPELNDGANEKRDFSQAYTRFASAPPFPDNANLNPNPPSYSLYPTEDLTPKEQLKNPNSKDVADIPELPTVPSSNLKKDPPKTPDQNDSIDFDELNKRFEELKKKR